MSLSEHQKAAYDALWDLPEYRARSAEEQLIPRVMKYLDVGGASPSVISLGCGTGRGLTTLRRCSKCFTTGIDISERCLDRSAYLDMFIVADISNQRLPRFIKKHEYGMCIDTLQHLPESYLFMALKNLKALAKRSFIQVDTETDKMGRVLVGRQLHLTVQSIRWWDAALNSVFKDVQQLSGGCFVVS